MHASAILLATLLSATASTTVRDSLTGLAVDARISDARGHLVARAEGYEPMELPAGRVPVTVWLDPAERPEELRPSSIMARLRADAILLHGHVSDSATGTPLANAVVTVRGAGVSGRTDGRGYFSMHVPARWEGDYPAGDDLAIEAAGYQSHVIVNTPLAGGTDTHFIVQMEPGSGSTSRDDGHKIWLHRPGVEHPQEDAYIPGTDPHTHQPEIVLPETIRVGFECPTANTCGRIEVLSLETYVKRGLNDEWIASWLQNSLRAGAVAYRSYGVWHVNHPRTATYDICSTTSCQVNDTDRSFSTDVAVDATTGVLLIMNGEAFRSEYSAENNNLRGERSCNNIDVSCGDGFAGSPAAFWPCLHDPVCTGHSCFGHGRGMCQWGSQRWALVGAHWIWILNHYYNDNGRPGGLRSATVYGFEPGRRRRAVGR